MNPILNITKMYYEYYEFYQCLSFKDDFYRFIVTFTSCTHVTMPHISFRDVGNLVHQAALAVNERFDTIEPAIYQSGELSEPVCLCLSVCFHYVCVFAVFWIKECFIQRIPFVWLVDGFL